MPRKTFKSEPTGHANLTVRSSPMAAGGPHTQQETPFSSGDTVLIEDGSDATVVDGLVDEGYHTNHENKRADRLSSNDAALSRNVASDMLEDVGGPQVLCRGVKELVQVVQELRHLGVENVLPLPKIVVVGGQSAGKSSVIEAISEIKVPRSVGTCTRCPLEINLSESSKSNDLWVSKVLLVKQYTYTGKLDTSAHLSKANSKLEGATRGRPLGPWSEQKDIETYEFATIYDKDKIESTLRLAQLAILNPAQDHRKYMPENQMVDHLEPKDQGVKFSPNLIRLDISGPDLPNLSFYDLPGVINVPEVDSEAYLVPLVRNLVKKYIEDGDCINLLALSMTEDIANSQAFHLVNEVNARGRTLGCLTKPDRMQEGYSIEEWSGVFNGQKYGLGFGYHVVKNNADPGVNHKTARQEEVSFFEQNEPWATDLRAYRDRFGTTQLQAALSERLTAQIRISIPRISDQLQEKSEQVDTSLKQLPEPLDSNLAVNVMSELITFERLLANLIDGGNKTNPFQKEWNLTALRFRQDLAETRPVLVFSSPQTPQRTQSSTNSQDTFGTPTPAAKNRALISIDSDDSDDEEPVRPSPAIRRIGQKRPSASTSSTPNKLQRTTESHFSERPKAVSAKRFTLPEVRNILQDAYIGLNNLIDPKAIETMIVLSMEHWDEPVNQFLARTRHLCQGMVFEQVQNVYAKYRETQYYEVIRLICEAFFEKAFTEQGELLKRVLKWEQSRPKTCNDEAIALAQTKAFNMLQTKRHEMRATTFLNEQEARTGKLTNGQSRIEKLAKVTDAQLGPDPYKKEIEAVTTVKAYYECAYYRFVDVVCASMHCELFTKCRDDIVKAMRDVFRLTDSDAEERLTMLLASNPEQEERRAHLKKELDTITKAQQRLESLTSVDE